MLPIRFKTYYPSIALSCRRYSVKVAKQTKSKYSNTLCLPETKFPLRLEGNKLINRDEHISKSSGFQHFYLWQRENLGCIESQFILHDGPPYANGPLHMGHAINKILKDILVRYQICQGHKVHYVPGWDCHGLPIELKACKSKTTVSPVEIRQKAKKFAEGTVELHKNAFKSWGILGDWDNCYVTNKSNYVQNQLHQFFNLYEKGLIYRDLKPVFWSPSSRTALAEAELEYNAQHKSLAATVRLSLTEIPNQIRDIAGTNNVYALVWTTTPWTLPANQAVCFNPSISYSLVQSSRDSNAFYIAATNRVEHLKAVFNCELNVLHSFAGDLLQQTKYLHPLQNGLTLPFLPGGHTTDSKGTGLVHTAPAHGPDDFLVALKNNIDIKCLVDADGRYTDDAIEPLRGLKVLTEGNATVLDLMRDDVLNAEDYVHSYPYDWRTKQPVLLRASKQWFMDTDAIKDEAIELLEKVRVVPERQAEVYKKSLMTQLVNRPYWCISRQRVWGVPIPVFYEKSTGKPVVSKELVVHLCDLFDKKSADAWWQEPVENLITQEILDSNKLALSDVEKGEDILDIWFDSGLSWSAVLEGDKVADMYLEGVDQFTGWFQSSLLTSVALRHKAPYKMIYVHGFVVDENGKKMSKSLGNVINPEDIIKGGKKNKAFGLDALRWWTACHANQKSVSYVSFNILQSSADDVQKLRSVLRFALSCLKDFNDTSIDYETLPMIDKYLLHSIFEFQSQIKRSYEAYQLNKVCTTVVNFVTNEVSALYYTAVKDRLYCSSVDDESRKQARFILAQLLDCVSHCVAPILPHLVEEIYSYRCDKKEDTFFKTPTYVAKEEWRNENIARVLDLILEIKRDLNKLHQHALDLSIKIHASPKLLDMLKQSSNAIEFELTEILQVSEVSLQVDNNLLDLNFAIVVEKSSLYLCERCRRVVSVEENQICERCYNVMKGQI